jgi:hypothetical protein
MVGRQGMCTAVVRRPNPARIIRHFFRHLHGHSFQVDLMPLGHDRHRRRDAGAEGGRDQVGRGKRFAFP